MRNWADDLPGDVLNLVLSKLFGKDRLSFSLVCPQWNAVEAASPYRYSPCLMFYQSRWIFYQYDAFFNMRLPEIENAVVRRANYGWLLMSQFDGTLFFFDPSNSQTITLPCNVGLDRTTLSFINPPTSPDCVVVRITTMYMGDAAISTLKRGEDQWESMEYPITNYNYYFWITLGAPVMHCGLAYFLSKSGDLAILDLEQRRWDLKLNCLRREYNDMNIKENYLVKLNGEEALYSVFVYDTEKRVNVFRLSSEEMKWDLVDGIGDKVMYLSPMSSFGYKARTKSMENTIYFPRFYGEVAVFYSLSDAKYHSLDGDYVEGNACGLRTWIFLTWLMPMPAQNDVTTISWL